MTTVRTVQVTFDCADPVRVGRFWCTALGYEAAEPPPGHATWEDVVDALAPDDPKAWFAAEHPTGAGPRLFFQRVPEGKTAKNRLHLDVRVGTGLTGDARVAALEAECARLIAAGATRVHLLPADEFDESCMVMRDVEGNEFCLD